MSFDETSTQILAVAARWRLAITDPRQLLDAAFQPTDEQVAAGLAFHLAMVAVAAALYAPVALTAGGLVGKGRVLLTSLLGLLFTAVVALTWHAAFRLCGGQASFAGTYLAFVYAAAPYVPLTALCGVLMVTGLPGYLRPFALNPATARLALAVAQHDPRTSRGVIGLASLGLLAILAVNVVVTLRMFSHVHDLGGWRLAAAVGLSLLIAIPVNAVLHRVAAGVQGGRPAVDAELEAL